MFRCMLVTARDLAAILNMPPTVVQAQHNADEGQDGRDQQPAKSLKISKSGYRHEENDEGDLQGCGRGI